MEFVYTIEEEKCFKKPTVYRLTYIECWKLYRFKWHSKPKYNYVDEHNYACSKKEAFKTDSKEEIESFKSFCIECDRSKQP